MCNVVAYGVRGGVAQHAMALLLELCRHTSLHTERKKRRLAEIKAMVLLEIPARLR